MGRLWQTLILSAWNPVFIRIPVESLVYKHQREYLRGIAGKHGSGQCAPFIEFMLSMIHDAVAEMDTPPSRKASGCFDVSACRTRISFPAPRVSLKAN
jgi:hypothetical protein